MRPETVDSVRACDRKRDNSKILRTGVMEVFQTKVDSRFESECSQQQSMIMIAWTIMADAPLVTFVTERE